MNFELSVEEANVVLAGLSKMPYEVSASVIQKLQTQAQTQLSNTQQEPASITEVADKKVTK
jgi:hypothetical protein